MTEILQDAESVEEKKTKHVPIRLDRSFYMALVLRMTPRGLKFQGLVADLLQRWLAGEFDAKRTERTITVAESEEDFEILRVVHRPANRAEVLVSQTVKHYLEMKRKDSEG